jgi:hypothetical protein
MLTMPSLLKPIPLGDVPDPTGRSRIRLACALATNASSCDGDDVIIAQPQYRDHHSLFRGAHKYRTTNRDADEWKQ